MRLALALVLLGSLSAATARAQTVNDIARRGACSTSGVQGLARQLIRTQQCMGGGGFVDFSGHRNVHLTSTRVHPYMQRNARDALHRAADRVDIYVTSGFRTVAEQYVLYHSGGCGAAARPGASNHQSGRAVDVSNWSAIRGTMGGAGCAWLGSFDPVHFDCPGGDRRSDAIRAFQRLWNVNHPGDRIAEDGIYGGATANRLGRSPANGFSRGGCCRARCDGDVVVRSDCTRRRCGGGQTCTTAGDGPRCIDTVCRSTPTGTHRTCVDDDRLRVCRNGHVRHRDCAGVNACDDGRCVDPECPQDGSRARTCADDGRLLLCEDRRGTRQSCGDDVCDDGACVVEACLAGDGTVCLDASTAGECSGGTLVRAMPCLGGCASDGAGALCEPAPCEGTEGTVCLDPDTIGECGGGALVATERCESGCVGEHGSAECAITPLPTDGGVTATDGGHASGDDAGAPATADGGTPPGTLSGGCSAGGAARSAGWLLLLVPLLLLAARRRGRARGSRATGLGAACVGGVLVFAATGCVAPSEAIPDDDSVGALSAGLTGSTARRRRAAIIRDTVHDRAGITQGWLFAGVAESETRMSHCYREYELGGCPGPSSSDCGGGPVLAGGGDGPCSWRQGGLGMYQFDAGDFDDTLRREGTRVLRLRGNIEAAIDFVIGMVIRSTYISGVSNRSQAIAWLNGVRPSNGRFDKWIRTVTHYYNGCLPSYSCWSQRYNHYRTGALNIRGEFGSGFWRVCEPTCDGDVVIRADCSRHRCSGAGRTCTTRGGARCIDEACEGTPVGTHRRCTGDDGLRICRNGEATMRTCGGVNVCREARCVDPECPADGSRSRGCAEDGRLLTCDDRRGTRTSCDDAVCSDGACVVEACLALDGSVCLDPATVGECSGGALVAAAPCFGGCTEDAGGSVTCASLPCEGVEGAVCLGPSTLGECEGGALVASEPCADGCAGADGSAACLEAPIGAPDAGAEPPALGDGGATVGGPDAGTMSGAPRGVASGGCRTAPNDGGAGGGAGGALAMLACALIAAWRRRKGTME